MALHKRGAEAETGVAEKIMSKTDPLKHLATRKVGKQTRGRQGPSGGARLPESVPKLGQRWIAVSHHHGVDVVATRKFSRTDPSTLDLLAAQAIQGQRQGREQREKKRRRWR